MINKRKIDSFKLDNKDKVSIIITNYKKEKYLKYAIRSCLKQEYSNLEIIVIDDCSNRRKSLNISRVLNDGRVRYFYTKRNYGHYACCNFAMDNALGKYVTFLGADDEIEPSHIGDLLRAIKHYKLAAVCTLYNRYDQNNIMVRKNKLCEASILFNKSDIINKIGYFHMVRFGADSEFRERLIAHYGDKKFGIIKNCSYKSRLLPNALTTSKKTDGKSIARSGYVRQFTKNIKNKNLFYDYRSEKMGFVLEKEILVKNFSPKTFREVKL